MDVWWIYLYLIIFGWCLKCNVGIHILYMDGMGIMSYITFIPGSSKCVQFLPFGRFFLWKGTNVPQLEDPGMIYWKSANHPQPVATLCSLFGRENGHLWLADVSIHDASVAGCCSRPTEYYHKEICTQKVTPEVKTMATIHNKSIVLLLLPPLQTCSHTTRKDQFSKNRPVMKLFSPTFWKLCNALHDSNRPTDASLFWKCHLHQMIQDGK